MHAGASPPATVTWLTARGACGPRFSFHRRQHCRACPSASRRSKPARSACSGSRRRRSCSAGWSGHRRRCRRRVARRGRPGWKPSRRCQRLRDRARCRDAPGHLLRRHPPGHAHGRCCQLRAARACRRCPLPGPSRRPSRRCHRCPRGPATCCSQLRRVGCAACRRRRHHAPGQRPPSGDSATWSQGRTQPRPRRHHTRPGTSRQARLCDRSREASESWARARQRACSEHRVRAHCAAERSRFLVGRGGFAVERKSPFEPADASLAPRASAGPPA